MNTYRRLQNIRLPEELRDTPRRTSVSRTVRDIRPAGDSLFAEIGAATVFERQVVVATKSGKFWVIVEVQSHVEIES